ncbi:MAG: LON peptidase substrate-binding domain-containing protein [Anaerolineaceae bacterium]|nr:LON peptidase substrate-binding domain-containing protein [Anaerolineaceae bacterium]
MNDIPIFPLHTVLFPGMPMHLHIFEERYKAMVNYCLEKDSPFGIIMIRKGQEAYDNKIEPYDIGCTASIRDVEQLENGKMNISLAGLDRFIIRSLNREKAFLSAQVEFIELGGAADLDAKIPSILRSDIIRYLKVTQYSRDRKIDPKNLRMPDIPEYALYLAVTLLSIPSYEKQNLLEMQQADEFTDEVFRIIRRETSIYTKYPFRKQKNMRRSSWLN